MIKNLTRVDSTAQVFSKLQLLTRTISECGFFIFNFSAIKFVKLDVTPPSIAVKNGFGVPRLRYKQSFRSDRTSTSSSDTVAFSLINGDGIISLNVSNITSSAYCRVMVSFSSSLSNPANVQFRIKKMWVE